MECNTVPGVKYSNGARNGRRGGNKVKSASNGEINHESRAARFGFRGRALFMMFGEGGGGRGWPAWRGTRASGKGRATKRKAGDRELNSTPSLLIL